MHTLARPNQCSQCSGTAKYTCPRCSSRTCSLTCVQVHKDLTGCSGIRDKTAYVSVKNFTNFNLLSDYRLLEEVNRVTSNAFRNRDIRRHDLMNNRRSVPPWLHRLKVEAKLRGTTLKLMPHVFSRRKENSTCFVRKIRKILWHVEWQFPEASTSFCNKKVDEDSTIASILSGYLDESKEEYKVLRGPYKDCSLLGIQVLLKATDSPGSDCKYYELKLEHSLKDALRKRTVLEFPVFLVVLKENLKFYDRIAEESSTTETSVESVKDNIDEADAQKVVEDCVLNETVELV